MIEEVGELGHAEELQGTDESYPEMAKVGKG